MGLWQVPFSSRLESYKVAPLNMVLYALFLHPLIRWLDVKLLGLQIGRSKQLEPVLAYADDVAVSVSYPAIGQ